MAKAALLVLAAGLGSRYGGIKQMDPVGRNGEFVLDYSIFDAVRAGFDQVVLVIRPELEEPLREHFSTLSHKVDIRYVVQDMKDLPAGFSCPAERKKPWGTGHAIRAARNVIKVPFAAINADDFYGAQSYKVLADFLLGECNDSLYAMVGFKLSNTLSENGTVSRGVASVDGNGYMQGVVERTGVEPYQGAVRYKDGENYVQLTGNEPVSLNFWGFSPSIFQHIEEQFSDFLKKRIGEPGAEFYIPSVVDQLVHEGKCRVRVLNSPEKWFGMTYAQDRALVVDRIVSLTKQGVYPDSLY
ncbi:MAG: NTP transferase domain-containing protein [Victivallales bacterium]|nr:NTP transferase domain-containing protein [Victivallales bacterium]